MKEIIFLTVLLILVTVAIIGMIIKGSRLVDIIVAVLAAMVIVFLIMLKYAIQYGM